MLNTETIKLLLTAHRNEPDILKFIKSALDSFEDYHRAVFDEQMFPIIYGGGATDAEAFREQAMSLDRKRTICHNSVIANVGILNRMAKNADLPLVYDGVVSEERPYRREVANAVFAYIEEIINNRT